MTSSHHMTKCAETEEAEMKTNLACVREKQMSNKGTEKPLKEQPQLKQNESESRNLCR